MQLTAIPSNGKAIHILYVMDRLLTEESTAQQHVQQQDEGSYRCSSCGLVIKHTLVLYAPIFSHEIKQLRRPCGGEVLIADDERLPSLCSRLQTNEPDTPWHEGVVGTFIVALQDRLGGSVCGPA